MSSLNAISNIIVNNAHRNMGLMWNQTERATMRLATGFRILSAADDPAGMGIASKMRAQLWSIDRANRNVQEAVNLAQTAESAVNSIQQMIVRMRELVIQAANDTDAQIVDLLAYETHSTSRMRIQDEINHLTYEIGAVANRTQFNNRTLLTGNYARPATDQSAAPFNALAASSTIKKVRKKPVADIAPASTSAASQIAPVSTVAPPALGPLEVIDFNNLSGTQSGDGWSFANNVLTITGNRDFLIEGNGDVTNRRIVVESNNANIVLRDVNVETPSSTFQPGFGAAMNITGANVTLLLEGENRFSSGAGFGGTPGFAGIQVSQNSTLTVHDAGTGSTPGTLTALGGRHAAGIGGGGQGTTNDSGTIYIHSGVIHAHGGSRGAGIGGGVNGSGGNINITGGQITAIGDGGAGIGGGGGITAGVGTDGAAGGIIRITGGDIHARSSSGAGIGGGDAGGFTSTGGSGGRIYISGDANILATSLLGAGIGGGGAGMGRGGSGGVITILGGTIEARADRNLDSDGVIRDSSGVGAGIGGGGSVYRGGDGGIINVQGGDVTASSLFGAGIGGGNSGDGGNITIGGGRVTIDRVGGYYTFISGYPAGTMRHTPGVAIGGGSVDTRFPPQFQQGPGAGATLTITGGLVEVQSGWIGGGWNHRTGDVNPDSGTVYFTDGNLSVYTWDNDRNWSNIVLTGDTTGEAFRTRVHLYDENDDRISFTPYDSFELTIHGRQFSGYVDSRGDIWVFLPESWEDREGLMVGDGDYDFRGNVIITTPGTHNPYNILGLHQEERQDEPPRQPYPPPEPYPPLILPDLLRREGRALHFQVGPNSGHSHWLYIDDLRPEALGLRDAEGNSTINVLHGSGAFIARQVQILDRAHDIALREQSHLGANINRLQLTSNYLDDLYLNLSDAEATISNADMATEFRRLAWSTIARHASLAVIAQANQTPQRVVQLLNDTTITNHRNNDSRRNWNM